MRKPFKRLKLWCIEKCFDVWLWWERRSIRERQCRIAEEEAHFVGKSNGTRYINPHNPYMGRTRGRAKARSPRRRH